MARACFPRLIIMAKEPRAGLVKTRLARETGIVAATAAFRQSLNHVAARLNAPLRWQTILAVSPDAACASRMLPITAKRVPQGQGDLGTRMARAITHAPHGPVILIGADIPGVAHGDIAEAFRLLGQNGAVLGPAGDGGYWLIGFRHRPLPPDLFRNVRWSSPHALSDTKSNLRGLRVAMAPTRGDFDCAAHLSALRPLIGRRVLPRV
jgi:rSAM/selenodomain-associated transferase 1